MKYLKAFIYVVFSINGFAMDNFDEDKNGQNLVEKPSIDDKIERFIETYYFPKEIVVHNAIREILIPIVTKIEFINFNNDTQNQIYAIEIMIKNLCNKWISLINENFFFDIGDKLYFKSLVQNIINQIVLHLKNPYLITNFQYFQPLNQIVIQYQKIITSYNYNFYKNTVLYDEYLLYQEQGGNQRNVITSLIFFSQDQSLHFRFNSEVLRSFANHHLYEKVTPLAHSSSIQKITTINVNIEKLINAGFNIDEIRNFFNNVKDGFNAFNNRLLVSLFNNQSLLPIVFLEEISSKFIVMKNINIFFSITYQRMHKSFMDNKLFPILNEIYFFKKNHFNGDTNKVIDKFFEQKYPKSQLFMEKYGIGIADIFKKIYNKKHCKIQDEPNHYHKEYLQNALIKFFMQYTKVDFQSDDIPLLAQDFLLKLDEFMEFFA